MKGEKREFAGLLVSPMRKNPSTPHYHYVQLAGAKWKGNKIGETEEQYEQFKGFLKYLESSHPDLMTLRKTILLAQFDTVFQEISGIKRINQWKESVQTAEVDLKIRDQLNIWVQHISFQRVARIGVVDIQLCFQ